MNVYWKLGILLSAFLLGAFSENRLHLASQVGLVKEENKRLAKGQSDIIDFNQNWSKADANSTPCLLTPRQRKLLK